MTDRLTLVPCTLREAKAFIGSYHRHNKAVRGARWAVGVSVVGELVGVATVGRPTARELQDGVTAEVTRCCTRETELTIEDRHGREHTRAVASMLYGSAWRAPGGPWAGASS